MTTKPTTAARSYSTRTTGVGSDGQKVRVMYMHCESCCGAYSPEIDAASTHVHDLNGWRCVACDATTPRHSNTVKLSSQFESTEAMQDALHAAMKKLHVI